MERSRENLNQQIGGKNNKKKPTMKDVANRSGVALSTVSHVINGTAPITEEVKRRVNQSIQELHYIPNALARRLRQDRTHMIGIIVPDISNEFYSKTASTIIRHFSNDGYTTVMVDTGYNLKRMQKNVDTLIEQRIDGLIVLGGGNDEHILNRASETGVKVLLADRHYEDYPSVEFQYQEYMDQTICYLHEKRFRKIGYISESLDMVNLQERYDGFIQAMKKYHVRINPDWIITDRWLQLEKMDSGKVVMQELIQKLEGYDMPEIIIASSDMIAIGIMDALQENGYHVPEDVGVIGIDDIALARYCRPSLTTIRQDYEVFGRKCHATLKRYMEHNLRQKHYYIPGKLVIRNSIRKL